MIIYLTMIFLTLLFSLVTPKNNKCTLAHPRQNVSTRLFVFFILILWCSIYSLRYRVGSDFNNYYHTFNNILNRNLTLVEFIETQRDALFGYIMFFSSKIFNGNWILFCYMCSIITYYPIIYVLYKKSCDFSMSLLLYIFTFVYFSGFNGVRQSIALSILFYAYFCLLKEKKYKSYIFWVLIAFGFHSTALIAIPFHLLSFKKINSKTFKLTIITLLLSYVFLWNIWSYVINFLKFTGQDKLAADYDILSADGSGIIRLLVNIVPAIIALVFKEKLQKHYPDIESEIILLCFAAVISLFSMKNWIFSRVATYLQVVNILFMPKLECIFDKKSRTLGKFIISVLYFAYMCALLLHGDGELLPYRFYPF